MSAYGSIAKWQGGSHSGYHNYLQGAGGDPNPVVTYEEGFAVSPATVLSASGNGDYQRVVTTYSNGTVVHDTNMTIRCIPSSLMNDPFSLTFASGVLAVPSTSSASIIFYGIALQQALGDPGLRVRATVATDGSVFLQGISAGVDELASIFTFHYSYVVQ